MRRKLSRRQQARSGGDHKSPRGWSLPADPHTGVITTRFILQDGFPVLRVVQDEDGDWQFVDNVHDAEVDDASIVCLHHILEQDPSLTSVVAELPVAHSATRSALGDRWVIEEH